MNPSSFRHTGPLGAAQSSPRKRPFISPAPLGLWAYRCAERCRGLGEGLPSKADRGELTGPFAAPSSGPSCYRGGWRCTNPQVMSVRMCMSVMA